MDDVAIRAITVGASVLIALITISAVLTYYTTAKDMVRQIGSGTDIAGLYEKSIEEILLKKTITGTELKNLINYFDSIGKVELKEYDNIVYFDDKKIWQSRGTTSVNNDMKKKINNALPNMMYNIGDDSYVDTNTNTLYLYLYLSDEYEKLYFENEEYKKYSST